MKPFDKKKFRYETTDTPTQIFKQIRSKTDQYFLENGNNRYADTALWAKVATLTVMIVAAYAAVLTATSFWMLTLSFLVFGSTFMILGINIGHDAAHHCLTGNRKTDDTIFTAIFGLQGLSGYLWQVRHNYSHHIFPNVTEADADVEITPMILLSDKQKIYAAHKYQHLYAPFLYMIFTLGWIFYQDFALFMKHEQGNLRINKIPTIEWVKLVAYKFVYMGIFLVVPALVTPFSMTELVGAFLIMHGLMSVFLSFTFFISHHIMEIDYVDTHEEFTDMVSDSWCRHQVLTTIDFNPESKIANFIFGGFNLHIAHHLFPEVSHTHYPALTRIIKDTLAENKVDWYKSFGFFDGVVSHLQHLKVTAHEIMSKEENAEMEELIQETTETYQMSFSGKE
jgi:linoleoyl-CoA desaturase